MTTYYVSTTGNDANPGTAGQPFLTIQKGANVAVAGDTVTVLPGTYAQTDNVSIASATSGTPSARIVFTSSVKWGAQIVSSFSVNGGSEYCWYNTGDYVDIVGFDITGTGFTRHGILNNASFCSMRQNRCHDIAATSNAGHGGSGIDNALLTGSDNDLIGNLCFNIGTTNDSNVHGLYHANIRGHVYNNICYGNSGWGIQLWHSAGQAMVCNNLCFNNQNGGMVFGGADGYTCLGCYVNNNICIYNTTQVAGTGAIKESGTLGANFYYNNLAFGGTDSGILLGFASQPNKVGTLTVDPLLVNWQINGSGDYHLQAGSPCIGAGSPIGMPTTDYDGKFRSAAHPSIGPYAFFSYAYSPFMGHL